MVSLREAYSFLPSTPAPSEWMYIRPGRKTTPVAVKCLLLVPFAILALVGIRLIPAIALEGWGPGITLMAALSLLAFVAIRIVRTR